MVPQSPEVGLSASVVIFLASAVVILVAGTKLARLADTLADATGLGEALFGAVLLGASTSLPGIVTSVTVAYEGYARLAFSNAMGGIAAQTVFLAIADMAYSRINLEHAAASLANIMQGALLIILLSLVLMTITGPDISFAGVHPTSVFIVLAYLFGLRMIGATRRDSLWRAIRTPETVIDRPEEAERISRRSLVRTWVLFIVFALIIMAAGYAVAETGAIISNETGLSETLVGALFTAVATSLPELVTSIAAVRHGAPTLAVGNIIGGNTFDVLFVSFSDAAYRKGSLYHNLAGHDVFVIALTILLTSILLLGLLRREKKGIANIGFESFLVLIIYLAAFAFMFFFL
ncbi:MAG: sodium:calcium antiporter [bacterium]